MATITVRYGRVADLGKEGQTYYIEGTTDIGTFTHPLEGVTITADDKVTSDIDRGMIYYTVITV
jgi:hypothetical protein